ncbi:MAG: STAS domain-containing protein [Lachnospiraceae bacterium]|nr:STAS domain-containing protein [Lachnospiraceae bacterium]
MASMLDINKEQKDTGAVLHLQGRIDTMTAPDFERAVQEAAAESRELVLDFTGIEYISSAGLRVLLAAQKAMSKKGGMILRGVGETVSEVFEITGFCDILTIEE